jgi:O-antigen/teichoic acid export membrane protein
VGIRQHFREGILHNATWMFSGRALQLAGRIAYFVIIAHALGPSGYGTFVACTALIGAMYPFVSFGSDHVMVKYASRDRTALPAYFGTTLLLTTAFGSLLTLFALVLRPRVLPASATTEMLAFIALSDLLGMPMNYICLQAFVALGEFRRCTQLLALSTGLRLVAAILLVTIGSTAVHWAYLYAASTMIATVIGLAAVTRRCGLPKFQMHLLFSCIREGYQFATSMASQSIYSDIDKTMLARLSTVESAAIYAVAYRFIEPALLPIYSLAETTYPEFFRKGINGVTSAFEFARSIIRRSILYGLGVTIGLFLFAGALPLIMGKPYAEAAVALRWLCPLVLVHSVRPFLRDALTGANYQWQRASLDVVMAAFNIVINLWIIRAYTWRGAAWSNLITYSVLLALTFLLLRWHVRCERVEQRDATAHAVFAAGE